MLLKTFCNLIKLCIFSCRELYADRSSECPDYDKLDADIRLSIWWCTCVYSGKNIYAYAERIMTF